MLSLADFMNEIVPGKIFYFACTDLKTSEPHNFICIIVQDDYIANFSCCTSKFDTVRKLIERNRYPSETLVYISPEDSDNPFKEKTYINCNEYFPFSFQELWDLYISHALKIKGTLPIHSMEQIVIGFQTSELIEDEIKELLPVI